MAEFYPTKLRATGFAIAVLFSCFGGAAGSFLSELMFEKSDSYCFGMYLFLSLSSFMLSRFLEENKSDKNLDF